MTLTDDVEQLGKNQANLQKNFLTLKKRIERIESRLNDVAPEEQEEVEEEVVETKSRRRSAKETSKPIENLGFKIFGGVGFVLIILGLFYFYQYAVDQGWLGHLARVILGVIFALAIIFVGEITRQRKYERFAQLMTGGGLAMLYFVVYATYRFAEYRAALNMNLGLNTSLLFAVICLGVWVSLRQKSLLLSVFAFMLGYLTSFLSDGTHQMMISTILLTAGFIYLDGRHEWNAIAWPVAFSYILYSTFFFSHREPVYGLIYLFVLAGIFTWYAFKENSASIGVLVASAMATLGFGLSIVWEFWHELRGLFVLGLAIAYGVLSIHSYKKTIDARTFTLGLIAIALVSIAVPVQLEAQWFTIAWAAEALILVAAGKKYGVERAWFIGCILATVASYHAVSYDLVFLDFGQRTINVLAAVIALLGSAYLLRQEKTPAKVIMGVAGLALLTALLSIEVLDVNGLFVSIGDEGRFTLLLVLWCAEAWALLLNEGRIGVVGRIAGYVLIGMSLAAAFTYNSSVDFSSRTFNYLIVLASTSVAAGWLSTKKLAEKERDIVSIMIIATIVLLVIASAVETLDAQGLFSSLSSNGRQVTLSILWALEAILILGIYFTKKTSPLQLAGVALFGITVLKILFFDLNSLSTLSRTIVAIIVGLIALGVSFVYVKNKKIIEKYLKEK